MKALLSSYITALVLLALVIAVGVGVSRQFSAVSAFNDTLLALRGRLTQAEQDNKDVQQDLEELKSDERIEQEARQRLNLKKEGEYVVIIIPSDEEVAVPVSGNVPQSGESEPQGFFQNLFGWLGGIF